MFRSADLREEYETLKAEMQAAEANAQTNLSKKRDIMLELREAKLEKNEAKRFQTLKDNLVIWHLEMICKYSFFKHFR
jgi:structural maintenance of chromosome 1